MGVFGGGGKVETFRTVFQRFLRAALHGNVDRVGACEEGEERAENVNTKQENLFAWGI